MESFPKSRQDRKDFWDALKRECSFLQSISIELLEPNQPHDLAHFDLVLVHDNDDFGFSDHARKERVPCVKYGMRSKDILLSQTDDSYIPFLPLGVLQANIR